MIDQWYEQYNAELIGYIRSKGFTPEDADDLCAQVFLEAVRCQPADTAPRAWLYLVARNRMIDAWRRIARRPVEALGDLDVAAAGDFAVQVEADDEKAQLRTLIGQLAPCHRQILTSRFFDDRSLQEIAGALSTTVSAVKARQSRALVALRRLTEPQKPKATPRPKPTPQPTPDPEPADPPRLDGRAALLERCLRLEMEVDALRSAGHRDLGTSGVIQ